ncbi:FCD domain-containing protein [Kitasatospora sp. NPDC127059]|uniref:FCD domain-containing protein n=1 Tax=unclassified Kitasatospora TaxID=2633591 RepID=UPI00365C754E
MDARPYTPLVTAPAAATVPVPSLREAVCTELDRWYAMREDPPAPDPRFVVQDERFHAEPSRASGNPALTDALAAVNERIRRVRMYDFLSADRVGTTVTEHIEIMELIRDGRLDEGYRTLHAHVGDSMAVVLEQAQRAMTQMAVHADCLWAPQPAPPHAPTPPTGRAGP